VLSGFAFSDLELDGANFGSGRKGFQFGNVWARRLLALLYHRYLDPECSINPKEVPGDLSYN
jgi:hypothetical protein